jgi:hypothetical protein
MLPAPPWMIRRGVIDGASCGCDLYSIVKTEDIRRIYKATRLTAKMCSTEESARN